jgi:colanic acid biosynthesis glycosyl transferase WcaI
MPGTMTRLTRSRIRPSTGARPAVRNVALIGADASPHVTGFPGLASALIDLLAANGVHVARPLESPMLVSPGSPGAPELVIAVLPGPGAAGAGAELADRYGVPLLAVHQGESRPPAADSATTGARLAARLQGTALRRADRWAVLSEAARHQLHALGVPDTRIERLPYWAPAPAVGAHPAAERRTARARLGWDDGFTVVCPVGVDAGGAEVVTEAARLLSGSAGVPGPVRIRFVGRGPRLRALAASLSADGPGAEMSVTEVDDDLAYRTALRAADVLLVGEAAGRPDPATAGRLAAGLAAGRPVIAAVPGDGDLSAELAAAEGAMVTVPPDHPRRLADAVDVLRGAPQARAVMAAAARHYARACLSPAAALETLERIAARTLIAKGER